MTELRPETEEDIENDDVNNFAIAAENFGDFMADTLTEEGGDLVLEVKTLVFTECENCQKPLKNPVIVMVNSTDDRDSAVVCKENCVD